jgi:hypothetical protein
LAWGVLYHRASNRISDGEELFADGNDLLATMNFDACMSVCAFFDDA